jgi:hypothetical protein
LEGKRVSLSLPQNCPPDVQDGILASARANREALAGMLREMASKAPSRAEIERILPAGVKVVTYEPREVPFAVAPVSIVTDAGLFFTAYLRDLSWRMEHPEGHAAAPLPEIFGKLSEAGLELRFKTPSELGGE